jgi:hypothetical protein
MWKLSQVVEQLRASVEAFKLPDNSKISSRDLPQNSNGTQQRRPRLSRY